MREAQNRPELADGCVRTVWMCVGTFDVVLVGAENLSEPRVGEQLIGRSGFVDRIEREGGRQTPFVRHSCVSLYL